MVSDMAQGVTEDTSDQPDIEAEPAALPVDAADQPDDDSSPGVTAEPEIPPVRQTAWFSDCAWFSFCMGPAPVR